MLGVLTASCRAADADGGGASPDSHDARKTRPLSCPIGGPTNGTWDGVISGASLPT